MPNINDIYASLLEKEALRTKLTNKYRRLSSSYTACTWDTSSVKNINLIELFRDDIYIYISLETFSPFNYRVSLTYAYKGIFSDIYGLHYYHLKYKALEYMYQIVSEFENNDITLIISRHIELLDKECLKLKKNIANIEKALKN